MINIRGRRAPTESGAHVRGVDLVREVVASLAATPLRAAAVGIGIALAAAAFVATLGLSATLSQRVSDGFDAARATEVSATRLANPSDAGSLCPVEAVDNLTLLRGVRAAGEYDVAKGHSIANPLSPDRLGIGVLAIGVDSGSLRVVRPVLSSGRLFDTGHLTRHDRVMLVPTALQAGLRVSAPGQTVMLNEQRFTVIGFYSDVLREPAALGGVLIPFTTLSDVLGRSVSPDQVRCGALVETAPGAASPLAEQVALALEPGNPDAVDVLAPPDPSRFRESLQRPVRLLSLALSAAALVIGAVMVATSTSANVSARSAEIGLRKAIGARDADIALQVCGEALLVGLLGSILGAFLGCYVVIGIALSQGWSPVLDLVAVGLACGGGGIVGALAGLIPALRAARLPPVTALRR